MKVSAVVISHRHARELERSLPALAPQVDELLVIANVPGSLPFDLPDGVRLLANERPLSFAANANLGAAGTEHELVLIANPDARPEADAVAYAGPGELAETVARVLADPEPWSRAGLERARLFSWEETARRTAAVYREILS